MGETYYLKNKNFKIKVLEEIVNEQGADQEERAKDEEVGDGIAHEEPLENANPEIEVQLVRKSLIIEKDGITLTYESDDEGYITGHPDIEDKKVTIEEYLQKEKRSFYSRLLRGKYGEIENIVILSGAGSSVGIGSEKVGLTMAGLWTKLAEGDNAIHLKYLIRATDYCNIDAADIIDVNAKKDLELLLSKAGMLNAVKPDIELEGAINGVKSFIVGELNLKINDQVPHSQFLNKVALRTQKYPRVKIFTLNYDTLFEQAALKERFTVIDGFTFSNPRIFNGKYFDYDIIETRHNRQDKKDSTIAKLFYLFKMHGSLNWRIYNDEIEQFEGAIDIEDQVMIFPQNNKYEHSYEQPYFEMMARFQQALRAENTLLITIGFSFYDKHVSSVILESLKQNSSLNIIAVNFPNIVGQDEPHQIELHKVIDIQSRVSLVAEQFSDFAANYPENMAHHRYDILESLNEGLKQIRAIDEQA